ERNFLPIDRDYDALKPRGVSLRNSAKLRIFSIDAACYGRSFIAFESSDVDQLSRAFDSVFRAMQSVTNTTDEPLMNLLASYKSGAWRLTLFPRAKHRPSFYFAEGDEKLLLSPAAVEMGGVCTLPVERDFERLTK